MAFDDPAGHPRLALAERGWRVEGAGTAPVAVARRQVLERDPPFHRLGHVTSLAWKSSPSESILLRPLSPRPSSPRRPAGPASRPTGPPSPPARLGRSSPSRADSSFR